MIKYFIFGILFCAIIPLFAQLSPGDLSEPHSQLEGLKNCTKCHEIGEKVKPENCLNCHVLLKDRIKEGIGLHARNEFGDCVTCHSDHQGREFNLIWWKEGVANFDHSKTGYVLEGKHLNLDCRKCHTANNIKNKQKYTSQQKNLERTYLGLNKKCLNCHEDAHLGQLDTNCLKCHDLNAWKPAASFDHGQARFPLAGKHLSVDCISCHKPIEKKSNSSEQRYIQYSGLKFSNCSNCHRDPHEDRLGGACKNCHTVSGWKGIVNHDFNHDQTRFPLLGQHQTVSCDKCHRSGQSLKNLAFNRCSNCHKDFHQGQFYHRQQKGACDECHTVDGFLPATFTVKQHNMSPYPLQGAHLAVPCNMCHPKNNNRIRFSYSSTGCQVCHHDPHNKESELYLSRNKISFGNDVCQYCHTVESWSSIEFDHSKTNFRLEGKHQTAECKSCHKYTDHKSNINVILKIDKNACQDCHQDIHMGQFSSEDSENPTDVKSVRCDNCHTTENWNASKFNHNIESRFKLEGAHKKLKCSQCHKPVNENGKVFVKYKPLNSSCSACHVNRSMVQ
jgi:nitrate/TMAO reductase-like tetraheme cytochrome c subunit